MIPVAGLSEQRCDGTEPGPVRFAIIGAGVIGNVHARLISSLAGSAELAAVIDPVTDRAEAIATKHGAVAYSDTESAYAVGGFDAVAVCVPSGAHADIAVEALNSGKHALIEKPLATTLPDANRIIEAEKASGRTVAVVSQRRFQPSAALMRKIICEGGLGRVTSGLVESAFFRSQDYYDSDGWRGTRALDGGGALMNQGIHALDLMLWMMGTPRNVSAKTAVLAHERIEVEDVAAATIEFESGAIGVLLASTAASPGLPVRLTVHGDSGTAVLDGDQLHLINHTSNVEPTDQKEAGDPDGGLAGWNATDLAHRSQYEDFIRAVLSDSAPMITTHDGRRSMAVVLAVYESARTDRPIRFNEASA